MKQIPKNITIGEMWDSGIWYWKLWILAPLIVVVTILGSLLISATGGSGLWFLLGYPLAIVEMIAFKVWDKRVNKG